MNDAAFQRHDELAPRLMRDLVHGTLGAGDGTADMLTVLTSVAFGAIEMASQFAGNESLGRTAYLHAFVMELSARVDEANRPVRVDE